MLLSIFQLPTASRPLTPVSMYISYLKKNNTKITLVIIVIQSTEAKGIFTQESVGIDSLLVGGFPLISIVETTGSDSLLGQTLKDQ